MSGHPTFTYGPVPSRRLGRSLGVSPIPHKTCSYSCVYCQLGRTTSMLAERRSFFDPNAILDEIEQQVEPSNVDFVTFVGDGEPTLSLDLGWLIREVKREFNIPVAVITNGSTLDRTDVRQELTAADVVLPSLDAGSEAVFKAVNRPHGSISFQAVVRGLMDFRRIFAGQLWLEVMLVRDVNDDDDSLLDIAAILERVHPDRVYLTTPIRPPAESWVDIPTVERILKAQELLGGAIGITELEGNGFDLHGFHSASEALLDIGSRHPLRLEQAHAIEQEFSETNTVASMLENEELVRVSYHAQNYLLPHSFIRSVRQPRGRTT